MSTRKKKCIEVEFITIFHTIKFKKTNDWWFFLNIFFYCNVSIHVGYFEYYILNRAKWRRISYPTNVFVSILSLSYLYEYDRMITAVTKNCLNETSNINTIKFATTIHDSALFFSKTILLFFFVNKLKSIK